MNYCGFSMNHCFCGRCRLDRADAVRNNSFWLGDWRLMHRLVRWLMVRCGFMRMLDELMHDLCGIAVGVGMMVIHRVAFHAFFCADSINLITVAAVAVASATAATAARLIAIRFCSSFFTRSDQQIRLHGRFCSGCCSDRRSRG